MYVVAYISWLHFYTIAMASLNTTTVISSEYRRIENDLRRRIETGQWSVGTMLPSRRELAKEYGVSPLTIERAITHLIADGTLRADNRRGTFVARGFAVRNDSSLTHPGAFPQRVATVGIIALDYSFDQANRDHKNYWDRRIVEEMEQVFSEWGHSTIVLNRAHKNGMPSTPLADSLQMALANKIDAIAIICFDLAPAVVDTTLARTNFGEIPVACILTAPLTLPVPHVFYENHRAGYQAAHHLLQQDYQQITVFSPFTAPWVKERASGMRQAIKDAGRDESMLRIFINEEHPWVLEEDPVPLGYQTCRAAMEEGWEFSGGVIGINDEVAFGLIQAASETGKTIGADYGILGFDDHPDSRDLRMTSLRAPVESMGREAARLLLQGLRQEPTSIQVRLHAHLIPRSSTKNKAE